MTRHALDLPSGIGLVAANMIGAGVLLSTGFLAQRMGPGPILLAWALGALLALCGSLAYATLASRIGRSGGEYAYLDQAWPSFVGGGAGWASLLFGFSAPLAVDAFAVGAFASTLGLPADPRLTGTACLLALALVHASHRGLGKAAQNGLVLLKLLLLGGFLLVGLSLGEARWPTWSPPEGGEHFPWGAFLESQYWIAFAYSGWNAAAYAASEFRNPQRDVPRALLVGCSLVAVLYLLVNWVFVANLSPAELSAVFAYESERVTLAHVLFQKFAGELGAGLVSAFALLALVSAMSAMTLVGPHVTATMAADARLPSLLAPRPGGLPVAALLLQTLLATTLLWTQSLLANVERAGAVLLLFSALTVGGLLKRHLQGELRVHPFIVAASTLYAAAATAILGHGLLQEPVGLLWMGGLFALGALGPFRRPLEAT